jgi:hypothetical protein
MYFLKEDGTLELRRQKVTPTDLMIDMSATVEDQINVLHDLP